MGVTSDRGRHRWKPELPEERVKAWVDGATKGKKISREAKIELESKYFSHYFLCRSFIGSFPFTFLYDASLQVHTRRATYSPGQRHLRRSNGSSSGSGSSSSPLADIQAAVNAASAGDTIYLRKGTYRPSKNIHFTKKGSSSKPYTIRSYNKEEVIVDGGKMPGTPAALGTSLSDKDRDIFHYENADDGIDLYKFKSSVTILDNIIFDNGVNRWNFYPYRGDGIGIKLGGGPPANRANVNHVARNNFSFRNRRGFSDNNMPGDMTLIHNTAWKNREEGFNQRSSKATYENNLAANNAGSSSLSKQNTLTSVKGKGNNWEKGGSWQDADFKATSTSLIKGRRQANGKIPRSDFLRPADGGNYGATTHWG
ncbi:hypothetical protein FPRO03_07796 [Fusarium proliferatum]|nr:hypothetical protein FPRO03_07796 [Fusarium proliferatum]